MSKKIGIILEGGAMRSIFTAGVTDFFLDKQINIPNVLAVSAGAYAGMNYVSGQRGRIMDAVVRPMATQKVLGPSVYFKTGEFFNMDLLFNRIPKVDCPFDFESFKNSGKYFLTSTISCLTGEAHYFDTFKDLDDFCHIIRVANSLPLLSKIGYIDGEPMMDGGMADAIPVAKAIEEGWDKIIVVFTRDSNYRKSAKGDIYNSKIVKLLYHKYPGLLKAIDVRPGKYNESIETLTRLEKEGKALIIRPDDGVQLRNREDRPEVLEGFYEEGYKTAERKYDEIMKFINE